MMQQIRHCPHCDARLARDQPGPLCSPCTRRAVCDDQLKAQRPEFWQSDDFRAAFAAQHFGWIILAYRKAHHPVLTQARVGRWLGMSQAQISRLEKPDAEPPCDLRKLQHWARALKIPPELLWFALAPATDDGEEDEPETTHGTVTLESVQRRDVIKLTGAAALTGAGILDATPWHDLISLIQPPSAPSVIGMTQVAEVRAAAQTFKGWDLQHGGGMLRTAVNAQLRYCADLLNARCTDQVRTELFGAEHSDLRRPGG